MRFSIFGMLSFLLLVSQEGFSSIFDFEKNIDRWQISPKITLPLEESPVKHFIVPIILESGRLPKLVNARFQRKKNWHGSIVYLFSVNAGFTRTVQGNSQDRSYSVRLMFDRSGAYEGDTKIGFSTRTKITWHPDSISYLDWNFGGIKCEGRVFSVGNHFLV